METNYEPIYIKIHFWKFVKNLSISLIFVGCFLLLSICGLPEWLETMTENSPKYKYPWLFFRYVLVNLALLYTLPYCIWTLWRIFYLKKPLLVISKEGFTDYSGYTACGFISWKEVKNINRESPLAPATLLGKYQQSPNIMVAVKNLKKTLQAIPFIRRTIIELSMKFELMNDRRFCIVLGITKLPTSEILKTMQTYKAEYDRIHKAKKINNDV